MRSSGRDSSTSETSWIPIRRLGMCPLLWSPCPLTPLSTLLSSRVPSTRPPTRPPVSCPLSPVPYPLSPIPTPPVPLDPSQQRQMAEATRFECHQFESLHHITDLSIELLSLLILLSQHQLPLLLQALPPEQRGDLCLMTYCDLLLVHRQVTSALLSALLARSALHRDVQSSYNSSTIVYNTNY